MGRTPNAGQDRHQELPASGIEALSREQIESSILEQVKSWLPSGSGIYQNITVNGTKIRWLAVGQGFGVIALNFFTKDALPSPALLEYEPGKETGKSVAGRNSPRSRLAGNPAFAVAATGWKKEFEKTISVPSIVRLPHNQDTEPQSGSALCLTVLIGVSLNAPAKLRTELQQKHRCFEASLLLLDPAKRQLAGPSKMQIAVNNFLKDARSLNRKEEIDWIRRTLGPWLGISDPIPARTGVFSKRQRELINAECPSGKGKTGNPSEELFLHGHAAIGDEPSANSRNDSAQKPAVWYHRIKGAAGSGKTAVLVERGVRLLLAGKSVLFLTFNLTARNHLQDMTISVLARYRKSIEDVQAVFRHFHGLFPQSPHDFKQRSKKDYLNQVWPEELLAYLQNNPHDRFDAVFVDEGQDWMPCWWSVVKELVRNNGEVLMVADPSQNLYGRSLDDVSWRDTGFSGRWAELKGSYRTPPDCIELLRRFGQAFLPQSSDLPNLPETADLTIPRNTHLHWIQYPQEASSADIVTFLAKQVRCLTEEAHTRGDSLEPKEIVCLCPSNELGAELVGQIASEGFPVYTTCVSLESKDLFHMDIDAIKVTTVHSFKGLEARAILLFVGKGDRSRQNLETYVGLTRIQAAQNSYLTVVCQNEAYREYGHSWEQYRGRFTDLSSCQADQLTDDSIPTLELSPGTEDVLLSDFLVRMTTRFDREQLRNERLNVRSNLENTASQNVDYLHGYFLRSFTELLCLFKPVFQHQAVRKRFFGMPEIRMLSYGCGTGGDLLGMLAALSEAGIQGKRILVTAVDGNADALQKAKAIIDEVASSGFFRNEILIRTIAHRAQFCEGTGIDFLGKRSELSEQYDLIESSKMFNELISGFRGVYFQFLKQLVERQLSPDGIALLEDIPMLKSMPKEKDDTRKRAFAADSDCENAWTPAALSSQVQRFVKDPSDFRILLPVPCGNCPREKCLYSAKRFSYRLFSADANAVPGYVCCRMIVHKHLYEEIAREFPAGQAYITSYTKHGLNDVCIAGEPCTNASTAVDGYRIPLRNLTN